MIHFAIYAWAWLVGFSVASYCLRIAGEAPPPRIGIGLWPFRLWVDRRDDRVAEPMPEIPSESDDWDREFETRTGTLPEFSRLNLTSYYAPQIRTGEWTHRAHSVVNQQKLKLSLAPGDVIYYEGPFAYEDRARAAERYPDVAIND